MKKINILTYFTLRSFNFGSRSGRLLSVLVLLFSLGVGSAFGISTTPTFKASITEDSPSGAGTIYGYRGGGDYAVGANGKNDRLTLPADGDWQSSTMTVFSSTIKLQETSPTGNQEPDGYRVMDKSDNSGGSTEMALHMYFFAKPNTGYQFDGWYDENNNALTGSRDHYPMPGKTTGVNSVAKKSKGGPYTPSTWDNGEGLTASSGYYPAGGFYYLRNVYLFKSFSGTTVYAKFSVTPRTFTLAKTGHAAVTYTATGYTGNISTDNVATSKIATNISLSLTNPDPDHYLFEGWYWSNGQNGAKTLISESESATFSWTGSSDIVALLDNVWIWPKVTRIVNNVAEVTYNSQTTEYESWDEALAAAKTVSGATVTLNKSVELTTAQTINKSMTLDLNGNTLSGSANNLFVISGSGVQVTITDKSSQAAGSISLVNSTDATTYAVSVRSGAKLTVAGGKIYSGNSVSNGTARGVEAQSGTTIEVTGGHIEAQSLQNAYALINRGTATISGGDMYAHTTSAATAVGFYNVGTSATITGGEFRAYAKTTTAYGIQQNVNNTITISGDAKVYAEAVTKTAYALARSNGVIEVNGGKYDAVAPSDVAPVNVANNAQISLRGGVYKTHTRIHACAAAGYGRFDLSYTDKEYSNGYRYTIMSKSAEPYVCKVKTTLDEYYYKSLEEAFAYVNANSTQDLTIVVTAAECTLSAGTYTIPSSVKLLVPYDFGGTLKTTDPEHVYSAPGTPSLYNKLILAPDAHIIVNGCISVGSTSQGHQPYGGCVYGPYGQIDMQAGSTITLNSGGNLYCWGFITGAGEITAKSGSKVYEDFQFACWRGGTASSGMGSNSKEVFPLPQYFIQNIEAKLHIQSGASEYVWTAVSVSSSAKRPDNEIQLIGSSSGLFQVSSGTLTKWFNAAEDRQMYELEGNMTLGSISMVIYININSSDYVLPLTTNMDIRIKSGTMSCNQKVAVLPGAKITIDEGANVSMGSNSELYIYDKSEWPEATEEAFIYGSSPENVPFKKVNYTATPITTARTYANMNDAILDINGTFTTASGHFYTTAGKANVCSSNKTGRVVFTKAAQSKTETYQAHQSGTSISYVSIPITAVQLHNGDSTYTATAGAVANDEFRYVDNKWINAKTVTWNLNGGNSETPASIFIKKGDALNTVMEELPSASREPHYIFDGWYTAASGGTKVELSATVSSNVTYYAHWTPRDYTITWNNFDGSLIDKTEVTYNTTPSHADATMAPDPTTKYIYIFSGWDPEIHTVDGPATYQAVFVPSSRPYEITWIYENGDAEETKSVTYGSIPSAPVIAKQYIGPDPVEPTAGKNYKYTFTGLWKDAEGNGIAAVTGEQTYYAQYDRKLIIEVGEVSEEFKATEEETTQGAVDAAIESLDVDESTDVKRTTVGTEGTLTVTAATETPVVLSSTVVTVETEGTVSVGGNATVQAEETTIIGGTVIVADGGTVESTTTTISGTDTNNGVIEVAGTLQTDNTTVNEGGILTIAAGATVQKTPAAQADESIVTVTSVADGGTINIGDGATLVTDEFVLSASQVTIGESNDQEQLSTNTNNTSGQVVNNGSGTVVAQKAYFELSHNGGFKARTWYAIATPWTINVPTNDVNNSGFAIYRNGQYEKLLLGKNFELRRYNGEMRAQMGNQPQCWVYVEDDEEHQMQPGVFYMVYMLNATDKIRLEKASGTDFHHQGGVAITAYGEDQTSPDANWNGIANPNTYHSSVSGAQIIQCYVVDQDGKAQYIPMTENDVLTVGTPVFVQTASQTSVERPNNAPLRARASMNHQKIEVRIAPVGLHYSDRLFIQTEEGKANAYTIGADVAKAGVSSRLAQMWVNRYDQKLCFNTISPANNSAIFPLGISIPVSGEYIISVPESNNGDNVYLTIDGKVVWNLSMAPYSTTFEQGTATRYGLRLVRGDVPAVTTDVDQLGTDSDMHGVQKVLIDNQVYIMREGELYNITGQKAQ